MVMNILIMIFQQYTLCMTHLQSPDDKRECIGKLFHYFRMLCYLPLKRGDIKDVQM